jgi:hypothetical protein
MAYLNFAELPGGPAITTAPAATIGFSPLEWSVVALAQRDRMSSLQQPSRVSSALGRVFFGERSNPRLADPSLEALRRVSVFAWHRGYAVPQREIRAFHDAGFSVDQYEVLLASISAGRAAVKQEKQRR